MSNWVHTSNSLHLQVAPVADASSAQSRADVALIGMAAVLGLTGLQWLALAPRETERVPPGGATLEWIDPQLSAEAAAEIRWCDHCCFTSQPPPSLPPLLHHKIVASDQSMSSITV